MNAIFRRPRLRPGQRRGGESAIRRLIDGRGASPKDAGKQARSTVRDAQRQATSAIRDARRKARKQAMRARIAAARARAGTRTRTEGPSEGRRSSGRGRSGCRLLLDPRLRQAETEHRPRSGAVASPAANSKPPAGRPSTEPGRWRARSRRRRARPPRETSAERSGSRGAESRRARSSSPPMRRKAR